MKKETKHLKFFGIGKILPFLKPVRWQILCMVTLAFISSLVDIAIPQFQKYALDSFVGKGTMATIVPFVIVYVIVLLLAAVVNYISCARLPLWKCVSTGSCGRPASSTCRLYPSPISIRTASATSTPVL